MSVLDVFPSIKGDLPLVTMAPLSLMLSVPQCPSQNINNLQYQQNLWCKTTQYTVLMEGKTREHGNNAASTKQNHNK